MKFGLHMVFQVLGALILLSVVGVSIVTRQQSYILAIGGFLLILAGAIGNVEDDSRRGE